MKKILLLGSQHGNELLGIRLYEYLHYKYPELFSSVDYLCANPAAFSTNKRFTESDLNRSYGRDAHTYEEKRAEEILSIIEASSYEYVLDLHTSTSKEVPFFLVPDLNESRTKLIAATNLLKTIIVMPENIVAHSLIGNVPNAISVEVNEEDAATTEVLELLSKYVSNLLEGTSAEPTERSVFYVQDLLKAEDIAEDETPNNYVQLRSGLYPVLYGEVNYVGYLGFKANKHEQVTL